jgi:hypothetical protein
MSDSLAGKVIGLLPLQWIPGKHTEALRERDELVIFGASARAKIERKFMPIYIHGVAYR